MHERYPEPLERDSGIKMDRIGSRAGWRLMHEVEGMTRVKEIGSDQA
jgi:hypothetical protein